MSYNIIFIMLYALLVTFLAGLEDRKSFKFIPSEWWQAYYAIFISVTLAWGYDLMLNHAWASFAFMLFITLFLFVSLYQTIKRWQKQNELKQIGNIDALSNRMVKLEKGLNELNESMKDLKTANQDNRQAIIELVNAIRELTKEIKGKNGISNNDQSKPNDEQGYNI